MYEMSLIKIVKLFSDKDLNDKYKKYYFNYIFLTPGSWIIFMIP